MRISFADPTFLTILLVAVILFALLLIAVAVFVVLKSRKEEGDAKPEDGEGNKPRWWMPPRTPGMATNFREAMRRLSNRLPGWDSRYRVPWYALVGEPGSGKTTIAETLAGIGADIVEPDIEPGKEDYAPRWLLLDQAVLIDIPGRAFLSTEAPLAADAENRALLRHGSPDRTAWRSFLRLSARYRPRQPLNGIVLTIPATELLESSDEPERPQRVTRIAELARRLDDVQHFIGLNLPVYILVTKCDAVTGFVNYSRIFFEQASRKPAERNGSPAAEISDDLLGWSNPHLLDTTFSPSWVDEAFDATNEVLLRFQLEMLAESETTAAADGVFLFPFELQNLRAPLRALLNGVFRTTAYHGPHLLRGIYFCGREGASLTELASGDATLDRAPEYALLEPRPSRLIFIRHLFEFKVFAERYLATPMAGGFFSRNRSVLTAQIAACILVVLLGAASFSAWGRLGRLQINHIEPVLQSLATNLDSIAVSSGGSVTPAVDLFNTLGASRENEYYSLAMPYSHIDLEGIHHSLRETLEQTFEVVVLRSCNDALEKRISQLVNSAPPAITAASYSSGYPPGNAWTADPAYRELQRYLSDLQALHTNIDRYRFISSANSGSFVQLNELLHYLGGYDLPDSSRFAHDPNYQRLLLNATWLPLEVPPDYDEQTATAVRNRIASFYQSWFDSNPLTPEVQWLAGDKGLKGLISNPAALSNDQLRAIVSHAQAMDNQLNTGTYDWLAENFNRESYPALGPELDEMPFADSQYTDQLSTEGTQKLGALKTALQTSPAMLTMENGKVREGEQVRTLASVVDSLLDYEVMADTDEIPCRPLRRGDVWNQADLEKAQGLETMRVKIEGELLPDLPGEYREAVRGLVDSRAAANISAVLQRAASRNPNAGDAQAALETEMRNLNQSLDLLKHLDEDLSDLHATAEETCLNRSLTQQASALLVRINQQLPALYSPGTPTNSDAGTLPVSQWIYGVNSADDLQVYLSTERQKIEIQAGDAVPLVQLLRDQGGHSALLAKWRNISQDVEALQAKKPDNPIQTLETFIATDLDKITPEAGCKTIGQRASTDVFLNVRAELARMAVDRCHQVAVLRFNEIAADFNRRLAGRFPFSQFLDTRSGSETTPADIAEFYQTVDRDGAGLDSVLPDVVNTPAATAAFLNAIVGARPLISGTAKDPTPALGVSVHFRTNRNREIFGNRIAAWKLQIGQQILGFPPDSGDGPALIWHLDDPVALTLRYANNSPEVPATGNPSQAAQVQGLTVGNQYSDSWSLFALLRDHPPGPADPRNQYAFTIPNTYSAGSGSAGRPPDTVVYLQVDLLPIGAKPGGETLPFPHFPYKAPTATLKPAHGD
jgi:type VI secretion system protein ImpL